MPSATFDATKFANVELDRGQYRRQLNRLADDGKQVDCIEAAVEGAIRNLSGTEKASFVIYGEPQSGKTEMMICLTARLLDEKRKFILHLLNDSVDLLGQNLGRFQKSGLAPAAKNYTDILDPAIQIKGRTHVIFCKKNARDLEKLFGKIGRLKDIVVIDDEADYASPNAKVNQNSRTKINALISDILGPSGDYVGVTATPARLDLNNTFDNDSKQWVSFPTHRLYTGQDTFFPQDYKKRPAYELSLLPPSYDAPRFARTAFFGFIVNVAYLNTRDNVTEQNYSMLIHTSGKRVDHKADWDVFDQTVASLIDHKSSHFPRYVKEIWGLAQGRYGDSEADRLTRYALNNITRYAIFILNSDRDFVQNGLSATNPSALFTIIIGGNIVSRGVTFENLLAMFFTRDVKHKLQQDTYIQRARMFGARGKYLRQFELTIPANLYMDWTRCFVFHRLALSAIQRDLGAPVWLTDNRIAAVSGSSIDRSTVDVNKGEMAFHLFDYTDEYERIAKANESVLTRLERLSALLGNEVFPGFLKEFMITASRDPEEMIAIHPPSSIDGYSDGEPGLDKVRIERRKGLVGTNQLEKNRYPKAVHHLKVFTNAAGKGRLFYKYEGSIQFVKNLKDDSRAR